MKTPSCGSPAKLLTLVGLCWSLSLVAAHVKSSAIVKVDASTRVSPNQKYSRLWQAKSSDPLSSLLIDIPGRIFVSHSSEISSDYDAEVTVSGSSENAVKSVDVTCGLGSALALDLAAQAAVGEFLLVEVRLRVKNAIDSIHTNGTSNDDLVILDNVLFSAALTTTAAAGAQARHLLLDEFDFDFDDDASGSSDTTIMVPVSTPKSTRSTQTNKTSTGFSVVEELRGAPSTTSGGALAARAWLIEKPERFYKANVSLKLAVPGVALVDYLAYPLELDAYAGHVMVLGDNLDSLDQVEVVSTHGSSGETVQVQFKTKSGAPVTSGNFTTLIVFRKDFKVAVSPATSTSVHVRQDSIKQQKFNDYSDLKFVRIANYGQGNIFVSAPESLLVLEHVLVTNYGRGAVQMDVGKTWTTFGVSLDTISSGSIRYFGNFIYSSMLPDPGASGKICLNATRQTRLSVWSVVSTRQSQVSYTGQTSAATGTASLPCDKAALPERVPTKILTTDSKDTPAAQSAGAKTVGGGVVTTAVLLLTATFVLL